MDVGMIKGGMSGHKRFIIQLIINWLLLSGSFTLSSRCLLQLGVGWGKEGSINDLLILSTKRQTAYILHCVLQRFTLSVQSHHCCSSSR